MTRFSWRRVQQVALLLAICVCLLYAGSRILGFSLALSTFLLRILEFLGAVAFPLAGAAVLAWFAYKLLLEPVLRQRRLDRLRERRARRDASRSDRS
jgi:hypothetical protein